MFGFRKFLSGINIIPKSTSTVSSQGDIDVTSGDGKINYFNGTSASPVLTEAHTAVVTNKTISGSTNTITDISASALTGTVPVANGGTGQTTQQAALNALAGAVTSGSVLRGNGTNVVLSAIQASDVPTLNQNTTGTAANITDSVNTSLTTLSSLSLPGSQVTGNISGNAANVTGTVAIANGGTGQTTRLAAFNALSPLGTGNKGAIITSDGTDSIPLPVGTDGQLLVADSSQASGLSYKYISGVKNYILNPDAEASTSGYATYANAASATPVTGSGGTATAFAFSRNSTNPLRGLNSFLITKTNTNGQGQGVSYDFTIDAADQAKALNISFDYQIVSGTYVDGDLTCYIYDVTNGIVIQPAGFSIQNTTAKLTQVATFQTSASGTSYRLIFHMASTSALSYSFKFDNVVVGPRTVVNGAAETDTVTYTPVVSGLGTGSGTATGAYSRVGDKAKGIINFTKDGSAGTGGATVTFSLPSGLSINTSVYGIGSIVGSAQLTASQNGTVFVASSTTLGIYSPSTIVGSNVVATGLYQLNFEVPIQGWSSNVQLSSDTDTRVVAMTIYQTSASIGANTAFAWNGAKVVDTHNAMNGPAGIYTVPVSGIYEVSIHALTNTAVGVGVAKNATVQIYVTSITSAMNYCGGGTTQIECVAGDTISIFGDSATTMTGAYSSLSIRRLSGPSVIAASETVAMRYKDSSGTTYPRATNITTFPFATKDYDTHNAYNITTGEYTVPVSGKYEVMTQYLIGSPLQITALTRIYKNGSIYSAVVDAKTDTVFNQPGFGTRDVVQCVAGDVLKIGIYYNDGSGTDRATTADATSNFLTISRIGN